MGGGGAREIKGRTGRQEDSAASIWPGQTWKKVAGKKDQTVRDVDNGKVEEGGGKRNF